MNCPKCGHNQPDTRECAECGLLFEKYYAVLKRRSERAALNAREASLPPTDSAEAEEELPAGYVKRFMKIYVWDTFRSPWKPVPKYGVVFLTLFFGYLFYSLFREPYYQLYPPPDAVMDSLLARLFSKVNLVFHEGGHWIFGIFGNRTLAVLGGSLNQILIPLIVTVAFWQRRDASGTAFGLVWVFINFLGVGIYMADARNPVLPLIANLDPFDAHDWRNLFNWWDLWSYDALIAKTTYYLGWIGMAGTALWYAWTGFNNLATGENSLVPLKNRKKEKDHRPQEI
ncbi:MAG: hypothetical protein GWM98_03060 [Nitrospinaceae bacterium]|nr:hypothetical protein [Nitrospinaceae bacterium]NIR53671.1 hypothetical protein [Nitrospinaceae bacterium]NIS84078.1 hypothetical protein [Nitrospinaceae bacterium]NIT80882.1 hypothetical protein [Nitrospinaceae bacterium]NIU43181.1 hypothetical protein [Nitrospinaceae bacterium]